MKTFKNCAAQGDLLIRRIDKLPDNLTRIKADNGNYIVAHSETGHHHVIAERPNVQLFEGGEMVSYLQIVEATDETEVLIEHLRSFDTHEPIVISPGCYEIRRQREYTPEGWRKVSD